MPRKIDTDKYWIITNGFEDRFNRKSMAQHGGFTTTPKLSAVPCTIDSLFYRILSHFHLQGPYSSKHHKM